MPGPQQGERRRFGDQIGEWDGQQWNRVDATIGAPPPRSWADTAVDALPMAGGAIGGALGSLTGIPTLGMGAVPGAVTGATVLGAGGEAAKQLINRMRGQAVPATPLAAAGDIALQGGLQGAMEGTGQAAMPMLTKAGTAVYRGYLKPSLAKVNLPKAAEIVRTAINENLPMTEGGLSRAKSLISELNAKVENILQSAQGRTVDLQLVADEVRTWAKRMYDRPGRDPHDYQAILKVADRIDGHHWQLQSVDLTAADTIKRNLQASAQGKFGVPGVSAEVAGEKFASSAMRQAIEREAPEVGALNMRESKLIDAARALARATGRDANTNRLYGVRALAGAAMGGSEYARSHDPYAAAATAMASQMALSPAVATRAAILAVKLGERVPGTAAADVARAAVQAALETQGQAQDVPQEAAR